MIWNGRNIYIIKISKEKIADRTYAYTYGKRGNITKITEKVGSGTATQKATYTYDALGQLAAITRLKANGDTFKAMLFATSSVMILVLCILPDFTA